MIHRDLYAVQQVISTPKKRKNQYDSFYRTTYLTTGIYRDMKQAQGMQRHEEAFQRNVRIVHPSDDTLNAFLIVGNSIR